MSRHWPALKSNAPSGCSTWSDPASSRRYSRWSEYCPTPTHPEGDCTRVMERLASPVLTRPTNSSATLAMLPTQGMMVGEAINLGMVFSWNTNCTALARGAPGRRLDRFQLFFQHLLLAEIRIISAGLAAKGFKPFCAIYSTFLQRAFDPIVH